jgi:hypothetical protein
MPEGSRFNSLTSIVLDDQTEKDETCRIVSVLSDPNDYNDVGVDLPNEERGDIFVTHKNKPSTARADFYVALEVLIPIDVRSHALNEGIYEEWREEASMADRTRASFFIRKRE